MGKSPEVSVWLTGFETWHKVMTNGMSKEDLAELLAKAERKLGAQRE